MGNTESSTEPDKGNGTRVAPLRHPSPKGAPPMALQRKGSSFLDEPVIHKVTERGKARVRTGCDRGDEAEGDMLHYAVSEMQGWRSHMEDKHLLNPMISSNLQQKELLKDHHLFAVFDGHGGEFSSFFCGDNFVATLSEQKDWQNYLRLSSKGSSRKPATRDPVIGLALLKSALVATFLALDAKLLAAQRTRRKSQLYQLENAVYSVNGNTEHDVFDPGTLDYQQVIGFSNQVPPILLSNNALERSGSTGVVVLITPTHMLCANAGDARAILSKKGSVLPLSFDHKPSNDIELCRVEKDGGFVRMGRVDGALAVSRSFGDFTYKNCNGVNNASNKSARLPTDGRVTAHPDIIVYNREPAKDEFIVLACDGIWDRLTNKDCAYLVRSLLHEEGETDVGLICEEVMDTALELDSRDNMTCAVILFPAAQVTHTNNDSQRCCSSGVAKRRSIREQEWGADSTPAKRAQSRLEERRKKNRDMIAMQKAKNAKSQAQHRYAVRAAAAAASNAVMNRQRPPSRQGKKCMASF